MLSTLEKILIFFGGSSGAWAAGKYLLSNLGKNSKKTPNTNNELIGLVNYWRHEAEVVHKKYLKVLDENTALRIEKVLMKSKRESIPVAMWEKDLNGRLIWCSDEYERLFLTPFGKTKADVLAKTDEESWGEAGKSWNENDKYCIENKTSWYGVEIIMIGDNNFLAPFHIYKNAIIYEGKVIGSLGLAIEIKNTNEQIRRG